MDSELIIVNGVKIEISRIKSTRDKRSTLVFLHEGLGCISMWKDFPYQLSEKTGMGAVIYSRVGYGKSDSVKLPRSLN